MGARHKVVEWLRREELDEDHTYEAVVSVFVDNKTGMSAMHSKELDMILEQAGYEKLGGEQ